MLRRLSLLLCGVAALTAQAVASPSLQFTDAWSPEAPPVAPVMAGYLTIHNPGQTDIAITGASCAEFNHVEIHDMLHEGGMMRMVKQEQLPIPAATTVKLEPGGMHVMFMKPKRVIKAGETLPVVFTLSNGETVQVSFTVRKHAMPAQHQHHNH
jgi:copper(I)-binding protein